MHTSRQTVFDSCRMELSCLRCDPTRKNLGYFDWTVSPDNTLPVCDPVPAGAVYLIAGTTMRTLEVKRGYYRVSSHSHVVLECHRRVAYSWGQLAGNYCAPGFIGPCEYRRCLKFPSLHVKNAVYKYGHLFIGALLAGFQHCGELYGVQSP